MSIFYCAKCQKYVDNDYVEAEFDDKGKPVCIKCMEDQDNHNEDKE